MPVVGSRTQASSIALVAVNGLQALGWLPETVTPEQVEAVNQALVGFIGLFLALKVRNGNVPR